MRTQSHGFGFFRAEGVNKFSPQHTACTHFSDFHEVVFAHSPEEGQTRCELVDRQAMLGAGTQVFEAVSQCIAKLDVGGGAGFLHMITRNGDAVEFRHISRGIFKNIADDPHGSCRRIDVGVTNHEFFQNIILDRTGHN